MTLDALCSMLHAPCAMHYSLYRCKDKSIPTLTESGDGDDRGNEDGHDDGNGDGNDEDNCKDDGDSDGDGDGDGDGHGDGDGNCDDDDDDDGDANGDVFVSFFFKTLNTLPRPIYMPPSHYDHARKIWISLINHQIKSNHMQSDQIILDLHTRP